MQNSHVRPQTEYKSDVASTHYKFTLRGEFTNIIASCEYILGAKIKILIIIIIYNTYISLMLYVLLFCLLLDFRID